MRVSGGGQLEASQQRAGAVSRLGCEALPLVGHGGKAMAAVAGVRVVEVAAGMAEMGGMAVAAAAAAAAWSEWNFENCFRVTVGF